MEKEMRKKMIARSMLMTLLIVCMICGAAGAFAAPAPTTNANPTDTGSFTDLDGMTTPQIVSLTDGQGRLGLLTPDRLPNFASLFGETQKETSQFFYQIREKSASAFKKKTGTAWRAEERTAGGSDGARATISQQLSPEAHGGESDWYIYSGWNGTAIAS
jgi:hypothetical protein